MNRVVVICGATATGKSDIAIEIAQELNAEIINADSMQLYRGMDIGTAKLSLEERKGVPHHLLEIQLWPLIKSARVQQLQRSTLVEKTQ
jgi:tRNA dimethylallyltransferase